jgi:hypothetical protein
MVKYVDVAGIKQIPAKGHCGLSMRAVQKHCKINLIFKKVFHVVLLQLAISYQNSGLSNEKKCCNMCSKYTG